VMNYAPIMHAAATAVAAAGTPVKTLNAALIMVSGLLGCELSGPDIQFKDGGDDHYIVSRRMKNGQTEHRARLFCSFADFERGVASLRQLTVRQLRSMQKKTKLEKIPFMRDLLAAHMEHFGEAFTPHKARGVYTALCFWQDKGHLPVAMHMHYARSIQEYLGHSGAHASWCYEFFKHDPSIPDGLRDR
jgi:hypothetical protein